MTPSVVEVECPVCRHPAVQVQRGRLNRHRRADRPSTPCPGGNKQLADLVR